METTPTRPYVLGRPMTLTGYSLKRTYRLPAAEGAIWPLVQLALLALLIAAPAFILFTAAGKGPGAQHAAIAVSLVAGLIVGALAQQTRFCMVGGVRDFILFRENRLLLGFVSVLVAACIANLVLGAVAGKEFFKLGLAAAVAIACANTFGKSKA